MLSKPSFPRLNRGHQLAQGLQFSVPLYEGSGPLVHDLSGQGNDGVFNASPSTGLSWGSTPWGYGVNFNASDSPYINFGLAPQCDPGTAPFTAMCLCYLKASNPTANSSQLLTKGERGTNGWSFYQGAGGAIAFIIDPTGPIIALTPAVDDWYMIFGVRLPTLLSLYVFSTSGGLQQTSTSMSSAWAPNSTGLDLYFSGDSGGSGGLYYYSTLAAAAYWSRALSLQEMAALWSDPFAMYRQRPTIIRPPSSTVYSIGALPKPPYPQLNKTNPLAQGLVLGLPMYEGAGLTVNDLSGYGNNGAIQGGVSWANSPFGAALEFDGSSGQVNIPAVPWPSLDYANTLTYHFTLTAWIYQTANNVGYGGFSGIFCGSSSYGWGLKNGLPTLFNGGFINAATTLSLNKWYWLAVVCDGTNTWFYINGVLDQYVAGNHGYLSNVNLVLGAQSTNYYEGLIADFQAFGYALSGQQLAAMYFDSFQIYRRRPRILSAALLTSVGCVNELLWNLLSHVSSEAMLEWNDSAWVGSAGELLWDDLSLVRNSGELLWNDRADVGNPTELLWDLSANVGPTAELLWNTLAYAESAGQLRWDALASLGVVDGNRWNAASNVAGTSEFLWNVLSATSTEVNAAATLLWNAASLVSSAGQTQWNNSAFVGPTSQLRWDDLVSIAMPGDLALWNARANVGTEKTALWNAAGLVGQQEGLRWNDLAGVVAAALGLWNAMVTTGAADQNRWNVRANIGLPQSELWRLAQHTGPSLPCLWDALNSVGKSSQQQWNDLVLAVAVQVLSEWNLSAHAGMSTEALWSLAVDIVAFINFAVGVVQSTSLDASVTQKLTNTIGMVENFSNPTTP